MSTRGAVGFHRGGIDKIMYNHSDSYPSYLGVSVAKFVQSYSIGWLNRTFDGIVLVNRKTPPTKEQIDECEKFFSPHVSTGEKEDWYALLRRAQGDLEAYAEGLKYMLDQADFLKDSLFCEWGYVVNLDTQKIEIYRGFQRTPSDNRYITKVPLSDSDNPYYNCKLIRVIPFSEATPEYMNALEEEVAREEAQHDIIRNIVHHIETIDGKPSGITIPSVAGKMLRPYRTRLELRLESKRSLTKEMKADVYSTIHDIVKHNFDNYDPRPNVTVGTSKKQESGAYQTLVTVELYPDGEYGI